MKKIIIAPHWIPIAEQVPPETGDYITYRPEKGNVSLEFFANGAWCLDEYYEPVTHWMPVPQPPKA